MPLGNIVILNPDIPERMHFTNHTIVNRDITDPTTGRGATRKVLEFDVDRLNGQPAAAKFSTMAETLYAQFEAYLPNQLYRQFEFIVTRRGSGFRTQYTVDRIPLSG